MEPICFKNSIPTSQRYCHLVCSNIWRRKAEENLHIRIFPSLQMKKFQKILLLKISFKSELKVLESIFNDKRHIKSMHVKIKQKYRQPIKDNSNISRQDILNLQLYKNVKKKLWRYLVKIQTTEKVNNGTQIRKPGEKASDFCFFGDKKMWVKMRNEIKKTTEWNKMESKRQQINYWIQTCATK